MGGVSRFDDQKCRSGRDHRNNMIDWAPRRRPFLRGYESDKDGFQTVKSIYYEDLNNKRKPVKGLGTSPSQNKKR